jgi:hypothetical protein
MIEFLIAVVPLLALLAALLLGRYPGYETALRLAERFAARSRRRIATVSRRRRPRLPLAHAAQGGLLLAFGLSGRAPPA